MIRHLASVGCSLALGIGAAAFLGCEEQSVQTEPYGDETDFNQGLDTEAPTLDGTGVGLDSEPVRPNPDRPGMTTPQDLDSQPNTPSIPPTQGDGMDQPMTPGQNQPATPDTPSDDMGGGM